MSTDKVTSKALAMKSFSFDVLILLTGCRDRFFMMHALMWISEKMAIALTVFVFSCNYIENNYISENSEMARMTTDGRNSRSAITNSGTLLQKCLLYFDKQNIIHFLAAA